MLQFYKMDPRKVIFTNKKYFSLHLLKFWYACSRASDDGDYGSSYIWVKEIYPIYMFTKTSMSWRVWVGLRIRD
jgi:hypothetical protein